MKDIKQLRIGNIVLHQSKFLFKVQGIENEDWLVINDDSIQAHRISYVRITPKWLKILGFKDRSGLIRTEYIKQINKKSNLYIAVTWHNAEPRNKVWGYFKKEDADFISPTWTNIKYVHQLQNIFHSLTGREIKINSKLIY